MVSLQNGRESGSGDDEKAYQIFLVFTLTIENNLFPQCKGLNRVMQSKRETWAINDSQLKCMNYSVQLSCKNPNPKAPSSMDSCFALKRDFCST